MSQASYMPADAGPPAPPAPRKVRKQPPQKTVDDFWSSFNTDYPGKVLSILPKDVYAKSKAAKQLKGTVIGQAALKSYDQAAAECEAAVQQISRECKRVNMRYRDKHFDIEFDLKKGYRRCLDGIWGFDPNAPPEEAPPMPRAVKRVPQIFKKPQFYIDDATAADVRQGKTGDCYLLAAVGALGNKSGLINKVCVARDEKVGVYGFVFHRDGEWIHTVVDDKLYLSIADYDESNDEKSNWTEISNRQNAEAEYREAFQTGSRALYFAQCNDENETWLPLLEKAYAKAHGDYDAIIGGFTGEAIEDLTGGVTTELFATDILDTDLFWEKELSRVNEDFLFGCATGLFDEWQGTNTAYRDGIYAFHAYTIMRAATYKGERLLLVRNPWGQAEWRGRWSDGSAEWTGDSMTALNHKFGDDGMFWISFEDLLRKYQFFDRTRLFDSSWTVSQQWTTIDVPWSADYNDTKFTITLTEASCVVIVLSQLDSRYWTGLEGPYRFTLHFRLSKDGDDTYTVRSHGNYWMTRSVSTELDLEPGTYSVLMKITATRDSQGDAIEDVVREVCRQNQEKLLQYGLAYDLAHAKGIIMETEEEKRHKSELEAKRKKEAKAKAIEEAKKKKYKDWLITKKKIERERRNKARKEAHLKKKQDMKRTEHAEAVLNNPSDETVKPKADERLPTVTEEETTMPPPSPVGGSAAQPPTAASEASTNETPESSRISDDTVLVEKVNPADETANSKIAQYKGQKPILQNPGPIVPALKVNDEVAMEAPTLPTPPVSPGFPPSLAATQHESDLETVVSYDSSVDTDLDELDCASEVESVGGDDDPDPANEPFSDDPWNAVCVVGLRVYSKEGKVSVGVVKPKGGAEEDAPLDVDDPSKGMSDEPTSPVVRVDDVVQKLDDVLAGIGKSG